MKRDPISISKLWEKYNSIAITELKTKKILFWTFYYFYIDE